MNFEDFEFVGSGFNGYKERYEFGNISISENSERKDMGVWLEMKGTGCREFELQLERQNRKWEDIFWYLYHDEFWGVEYRQMQITRLDIALDELYHPTREKFPLQFFEDRLNQGLIRSCFQKFDKVSSKYQDKTGIHGKGVSIYFGSRKSETYFNFYEKDLEISDREKLSLDEVHEKYNVTNRYEVRLRGKMATQAGWLIAEENDFFNLSTSLISSRLEVYSPENPKELDWLWRNLVSRVEGIDLKVKPKKFDIERSKEWFKYHVAPTVKALIERDRILGDSFVRDALREAELSENMVRYLKVLQKY